MVTMTCVPSAFRPLVPKVSWANNILSIGIGVHMENDGQSLGLAVSRLRMVS